MKTYIALCLVILFPFLLIAQEYDWNNPPPILEKEDTLQLEYSEAAGLHVVHQVEKYESIYRLSAFYDSEMEELLRVNGINAGKPLTIGKKLRIPIDSSHIITNFFGRSFFKKYNKVFYTMGPDETLDFLGSTLLDVKSRTLERRNKVDGEDLPRRAKLKVGWFPRDGLYEPVVTDEMKEDGIESKEIEEQFHLASMEGTLREQKGIAFYNKKNDSESGFFALHREAPVGSYLELINPMFGSKVYVKVIGELPEKSYPKEVLTVISNAAAKELGAKDARFFVKIRYLQSKLNAGKL